jgi:hypothetical protein
MQNRYRTTFAPLKKFEEVRTVEIRTLGQLVSELRDHNPELEIGKNGSGVTIQGKPGGKLNLPEGYTHVEDSEDPTLGEILGGGKTWKVFWT